MPELSPNSTIEKIFYEQENIPGAPVRQDPGINGQIATFGNSNCYYLDAFADLDIFGGPNLGFINFYANFILDGNLVEIPNTPAESSITGAGKENPINIDNQIILDGVFIGAGFFVYNSDPDPGLGTYGFSGLVYNGTDFITETSVATDQAFFDAVTEVGNNALSTTINRDNLNDFYFAVDGGCYQVNLTTGVYSFIPLEAQISQFLFCNDDVCLYTGTVGEGALGIYDLNDELYDFVDLPDPIYDGFGGPAILFDGTYLYLRNGAYNFPSDRLYRFMYNGTEYDTFVITTGDFLFGSGTENRITGGNEA